MITKTIKIKIKTKNNKLKIIKNKQNKIKK